MTRWVISTTDGNADGMHIAAKHRADAGQRCRDDPVGHLYDGKALLFNDTSSPEHRAVVANRCIDAGHRCTADDGIIVPMLRVVLSTPIDVRRPAGSSLRQECIDAAMCNVAKHRAGDVGQ
jgi:hypothetical protein